MPISFPLSLSLFVGHLWSHFPAEVLRILGYLYLLASLNIFSLSCNTSFVPNLKLLYKFQN